MWNLKKKEKKICMGFLGSSAGKESTCNSGDPSSISGSERYAGEGIGYPLQYSWASLVAQLVKNLTTMQETWVQSLGWEHTLEKGKATHSRVLAWRIPRTTVHGVSTRKSIPALPSLPGLQSRTQLSGFHFNLFMLGVLFPFHWGGNWDLERLRRLPMVTRQSIKQI